MSSFLGGSECEVNSNPLAKFSNRSMADHSVEQSARQGSSTGRMGPQRMSEQKMMTGRDRAQMEEFLGPARPMNNFNFQPMAKEVEVLHQAGAQQSNQIPQQVPMFQRMSEQERTMLNATAAKQGFTWSTEFIEAPMNQQKQNRSETREMSPVGMGQMPMYGGMRSQGFMPMQSMQNQYNLGAQGVQAQDGSQMTAWEDQFQALEAEETLQTAEEKTKETTEQTQTTVEPEVSGLDEATAQWEKDFEKYAGGRINYGDYELERENRFANMDGAYEIGCKLMESGAKLSEAALAFEAAVQENPEHIDAWLRLGQVQTQNEKELNGIAALEKCLELSPQNLTALMTLAVSYVNEGYDNAAYATLERWIETKYPDVARKAREADPEVHSDDRFSLNKRITKLFLKAAQLSPTGANVDADVQTGLGVLFYSLEEYDKTLDCFRAAIKCNPNDALSWNRLGASLANSNRPEQAIEAYTKALQLNPNFVRARYNLGVSYINMGMYQDAVEHLLTGLSMHVVEGAEGGIVQDTSESSSLMETLKRALLAMDRRDLVEEVRPGMKVDEFKAKVK